MRKLRPEMAEESSGLQMSYSLEKKKREILLSTRSAWLPLDEQQPPDPKEESRDFLIPEIENSRQESIQQWLNSSVFITPHENLQQAIKQTDSLSNQGVVPVTVNDYMRSVQQFSETPALSRGTSFNSCPSGPSIPKSISEWLEFWQKDPVEILLDLGFGAEEPDICTKIPARFLGGSSAARGINIRVFLEAQKQRMDFETPNLYGRFRQLEVLDHVTNAFSSLLNNVNNLQRDVKEKEQTEKPKVAQGRATQDRRRRIGQLLRRASKQTMIRMNFADHGHLRPLTEEPSPTASSKLVSPETLPAVPGKPRTPHLSISINQPPLPCTPEGPTRDQATQEKSLLLTHRLRHVVYLDGKPPDSFEMEEVQSFEEELGNPLEGTSGPIGAGVTRASSCQSDSSGFLEEPSEPFPLQISPLLTNQSLGCGRQESRTPREGSAPCHSQELTQDDSQCILSSSTLSQGQSDLEGERRACLEEDNSLSGEHLAQEGPLKDTFSGEDLERKDNSLWNFSLKHHTNYEADGGTITSKYDCPKGFTVKVKADSLEAEEPKPVSMGRSPSIVANGCANDAPIHVDSCPSGSEVPSRLESSLEKGMLTTAKQESPSPNEVTLPLGDFDEISATTMSSSDDVAGGRSLGTPGLRAPGKASPGSDAKEDFIPDAELSTGGFRSVTIQMPSRLVSGIHSTTPGEGPRESGLDLTHSKFYTNESSLASGPGKGPSEQPTKDASVQTEQKDLRCHNLCPVLSGCSATHRCRRLTQSLSLDSSSLLNCPSTSDSKPAVHGVQYEHGDGGCCCCCHWHHHHPCGWHRPDFVSCSRQCRLQAQLTRMVKILQEAVSTAQDLEIWKTVCQSFREHSEEIGRHLMNQQACVFSDMSEEGREEMRQLYNLRQDLHQQVTELEFQLSDRARQIREGMLLFDQLLEEQSRLCSELELSDWAAGREPSFHTDPTPTAPSPTVEGQGAPRPGGACTFASPSSADSSASPALAETSSDSLDPHDGSGGKRRSSQPRMDLKGFLCKLKKSFKSSFGNEPDGQN
uniref:ITPR-interacting domain-containing protein n=1 Tax=Monodelphis domestica TaxID=13616 RepID=F7BYE8_MONDO